MSHHRHPRLRTATRLFLSIALVLGGPLLATKWSDTDPSINETHIFEGEINRRGKPVGFHSRPGGQDPANARVVEILSEPNSAGVYTARVEIRKSSSGTYREKTSSMYPDDMSREDVLNAVLNAYENRTTGDSEKFRGPSGRGFTIEGYLLDSGDINTAYPIYTPDEKARRKAKKRNR